VAAFSQDELDGLISCPKEVSDPPKREMRLERAHWRNDAKLIASNGLQGDFVMFMRKNEDFPENFSIGLIYNPHDGQGEIPLFRCNGNMETVIEALTHHILTRTSTSIERPKMR